tara:strand:- start:459 stop:806 length:348 start_codon:yes stop_codon:yes gene_type:complete
MKALIFKETVIQLEETAFEVHSGLIWVDASAECKVGWGYKDGNFIPTVEPTDEEKTAAALATLRAIRNAKLQRTDWMANSDVTMSDAWKTYRQALRDLPANTSDPTKPTWPTEPN